MAKRQRNWAKRRSEQLRTVLGGKCSACGETEKLEFDCRQPKGHRHHTLEYSSRVSFYLAEHRRGNLQLLCKDCNAIKGAMSAQDWDTLISNSMVGYTLPSIIKGGEQRERLRNRFRAMVFGEVAM